MSSKYSILVSALLALSSAYGAEPAACRNSMQIIDTWSPPPSPPVSEGSLELETGRVEAQFGLRPYAAMSGGVVLRYDDKLAGADAARFDSAERAMVLEGNVRYLDPGTQIASDAAEFSYDEGRIRFEGAEFTLGRNNARGAASLLQINDQGLLELDDVSYTTCPRGSNDWLLEANDIDLDTKSGTGTARGVKLRFQGVPILYTPYLSFPIGDARKSGILAPEIGSAGRSGNDIQVPYYWNLAPNYDALLTPRLLSDRGIQLKTRFRYLTQRMNGQVNVDYLPSDNVADRARHLFNFRHRTVFANGWRNRINMRDVSDSKYFEDLGGSLSLSSTTHLNRSVSFDYYTTSMSFFGMVQDYQTLDDALLPSEEPYRRVPQLYATGSWPERKFGLHYAVSGEIVNFDRDVGVTGWRLNVAPEISLPITRPGWFVAPAIELDHTRYALSEVLAGQPEEPTRTVPIGSIDAGLILERHMNGTGPGRVQTIEPRVLYVHIPHRDQDMLPVFDTITPDLNLVQLYRKNRFLGIDRIGDTDQVSIGVTSRVLDVSTGKELISATVGQTRYLSERGISLPGETVPAVESSDYIAEVRFLLYEHLNFDIGHQWGATGDGTTQSEARLQYRPARNKILNLGYRFRRRSLEQGDLSWSWPLTRKWNFVGRYNFSFRDREALEQFFGLEYESCCWGLRLVSRRHISTRDGTRDSSLGLQLVLKGMSSVGTAADKLLERGILGYSADLQ